MVNNHIDFFIAIGFLLPYFLAFAMSLLQFLQSEPYTTNTGFIKSLIGKFNLENILKMPELWQNVGSVDYDLMLRQNAWNRDIETWN